MRRLLTAGCAAAAGLSFLLPVAKAVAPDSGHRLEFWTPVQYDQQGRAHPQPATADHNASVWSTDEVVTVKADFTDGVKKWEVRLVPVNGGTPSTCREEIAPLNNSYPNKVYINCPWDTTRAADRTLDGRTPYDEVDNQNYQRSWRVADHGPSVNGRYTIEVTVWNAGADGLLTPDIPPDQPFQLFQDPNASPPWRQVWVANGVADPTGVNTAFDPASNRIVVTWAPNPEPDVSYRVQEKIGDGQWSNGVDVPGNATRYERAVEHPGSYTYQVQAIRPAPTADSAGTVKRSRAVAAPAVEVAQIAPPTTAGPNSADGAPDGGDPGVFIPGDTSTTTGPGGTGGTARPVPTSSRSGPTAGFRPSGATGRPTGTTAERGEAEGEEPDNGFSTVLPYDQRETLAEAEEGDEEAAPQTLAGGVVPKPRDTRQLLIFMAISLALFVFAMQLTVLVRKSKPVPVGANQAYQDDFDDWLGGF